MASWRQSVKLIAADALYNSGALRARFRRAGQINQICVLGLHRVLTPEQKAITNSQGAIVLTDATFVALMEFLAARFRFVSLASWLDSAAEANGSKPACLLTFDDGWQDNYTTAFPVLKRLGIPALIFLATGFIGSGKSFWVERLRAACRDRSCRQAIQEELAGAMRKQYAPVDEIIEHLKRMSSDARERLLQRLLPADSAAGSADTMLDWAQVREMASAGIEFGSHTDLHPLLPYEDDSRVEQELNNSKQKLEAHLHQPAKAFAYPNGDWDERVRTLVENAGYECAFTTRPGWHRAAGDRLTVHRILLHDGNVTAPDGTFSPAVCSFTLTGWR
jgi:peptidoglycan/xylan/chitin deacetylase (PgdA/CDA1 family)